MELFCGDRRLLLVVLVMSMVSLDLLLAFVWYLYSIEFLVFYREVVVSGGCEYSICVEG